MLLALAISTTMAPRMLDLSGCRVKTVVNQVIWPLAAVEREWYGPTRVWVRLHGPGAAGAYGGGSRYRGGLCDGRNALQTLSDLVSRHAQRASRATFGDSVS